MTKYYLLTKNSRPGWQFGSCHLRAILKMADQEVCIECKTEFRVLFPSYDNYSSAEKLHTLLDTACGAEYILEEFKDYDDYCEQLGK